MHAVGSAVCRSFGRGWVGGRPNSSDCNFAANRRRGREEGEGDPSGAFLPREPTKRRVV